MINADAREQRKRALTSSVPSDTRADEVTAMAHEADQLTPPWWASDDEILDLLTKIASDDSVHPVTLMDAAEAFAFVWLAHGAVDDDRFKLFTRAAQQEVVELIGAASPELADHLRCIVDRA